MNQDSRLSQINDSPHDPAGQFVLYWMQASQRTRFNHALEFSIALANELGKPLIVCFGLMDNYPEANERHYYFMLQGLRDVERNLEKRKIKLVVRHGNPPEVALHFAKHAAAVVCDRGYLRHQKAWRDQVADGARCCVYEVESDVVCPVEVVSDKHEFAARTIRPKIHRVWDKFLVAPQPVAVKRSSLDLDVKGNLDVSDPDKLLAKLKLDRSVSKVTTFPGGENAGQKALSDFVAHRLNNYSQGRNEPADGHVSFMSRFLHFGQLSPLQIALAVKESDAPKVDRESYLEELIVRRELSMNFCNFNPKYDSYDCLPNWAKQTLDKHRKDKRPKVYSREELEFAKTADPYWNAAQTEMLKTGFMHNYMRMYWGKKILEWSNSPEAAFKTTLHLNNKYFIDGRDPNGYANVAWIFGLHDRPWTEREIFGTIRYMNAAGLERKFEIGRYVKKVEAIS
jgi:deoxyribodipyrimidine photo-lyase